MECEARRTQRLHRRMMQLTLGAFVLWNYIVYCRARSVTTDRPRESFSCADMCFAFDV